MQGEKRPDPDRLLHQVQREEAPPAGRGRLKIFFGYAAGVGKTYAMLKAAHAARQAGVEVVAGYIEPHTRPATLALLDGLEQLPPLVPTHKGVALREFDLDAALARLYTQGGGELPPYITLGDFLNACDLEEGEIGRA